MSQIQWKLNFYIFILLEIFSWNLYETSLVGEPQKEIKAQPIDQFIWIKFWGPILMEWSSLQNFSFVDLSNAHSREVKVFLWSPNIETTRKNPDSKKLRGPILVSQCFFRSKVPHENIHMRFLLGCVGDLSHMKKMQFWK
jgi:hypothetical protein